MRPDQQFGVMMRAAQQGDSAAYRKLLVEITPVIRRAVRYQLRLGQPSDVEDVVQDVLISLHKVRITYDSRLPFLPWLMSITRNRVIDAVRRSGRLSANEVLVADVPETFSDQPANITESGFGDVEALSQAIHGLPPRQRRAVELLKLRELSLKEASVESGMSIVALKVAAHRGIAALRKVLKGGG